MLLSHGCGRPIKRRDLVEQAKTVNKEFSKDLVEANRFLGEKMAMKIVELGTVPVENNKSSPKRNEYALVSTSMQKRSSLYKVVNSSTLNEWGMLCFILVLLVLKDQGITYSSILSAMERSHLSAEIEPGYNLKSVLTRLCARRILEVHEPSSTYFVGPLAPLLISGEDLTNLIVKLHFTRQEINDADFAKKYDVMMRTLRKQIEDRFG